MTGPKAPAAAAAGQPYPWLVPDLFRWFGLLLLSLTVLVVAWWGISGSATLGTQITWLNVGVGSVVIAGLGNMTWLLQGRRALSVRRRALLDALPGDALRTPPPAYSDASTDRVALPGAALHHRPDCVAVAGKPAVAVSATDNERAGRRSCGICG